MKKALIVLFVAVVCLCSVYLPGKSRVSAASEKLLGSSAVAAGDSSMEKEITAGERESLEALKTGDLEKFSKLSADEAIFVDTDGPADKTQVLKNVAGFKITEYSMENVAFLPLSANTGFVTYKLNEKGISHGKEFDGHAFVSSIWTQRAGKWVCLFSQETAAR
jgi:hypothetical protein